MQNDSTLVNLTEEKVKAWNCFMACFKTLPVTTYKEPYKAEAQNIKTILSSNILNIKVSPDVLQKVCSQTC